MREGQAAAGAPHREKCYRCMRPKAQCLCPAEPPMALRTKIVLLMHLKELRRTKCNTGRLAAINIAGAEIITGVCFEDDPRVDALLRDPGNLCALLYPGEDATDLSAGRLPADWLGGKRLVVFLLDATWSCAGTMAKENPRLMALPRLMFRPAAGSRYVIKKQPAPWCLSTLEAVHELLLALESSGLDEYPDKERLLRAFDAMQAHQVESLETRRRPRYRGCA